MVFLAIWSDVSDLTRAFTFGNLKTMEKEIESQILTWLNYQQGIFAFKINTVGIWDPSRGIYRKLTNPFTMPGTHDIIGLRNGDFFSLEVKTPTEHKKFYTSVKEREINQRAFMEKVRRNGGMSDAVSSLDQAMDFIKKMADRRRLTGPA